MITRNGKEACGFSAALIHLDLKQIIIIIIGQIIIGALHTGAKRRYPEQLMTGLLAVGLNDVAKERAIR